MLYVFYCSTIQCQSMALTETLCKRLEASDMGILKNIQKYLAQPKFLHKSSASNFQHCQENKTGVFWLRSAKQKLYLLQVLFQGKINKRSDAEQRIT